MNARPQPPESVPADATAEGDGVVVGEGPVRVDAFIDFLCPYCRQFEERSGSALKELVADGSVSIVYHPVAFLERLSTAHYSSRASAAAGAAADGGRFDSFKDTLFANQPEEGGPGHSDDELIALGAELGLGDDFAGRVRDHAYLPWTAYVTEAAMEDGVDGIPTVFVAGEQIDSDPDALRAAVAAADAP